jgi:type IV secretory pathway VirB10-like protein
MPIPERGTFGPGFEKRLKATLDSITPPSPYLSTARYKTGVAWRPRRAWRLAPALVGAGAAAMALTAMAATGSPNPAIWEQRAESVIQSVSHPDSIPKGAQHPKSEPSHSTQGTGASHTPPSGHESEASQTPEPTDKAESTAKPDQTSGKSAKPSPTPDTSSSDSTSSDSHKGD